MPLSIHSLFSVVQSTPDTVVGQVLHRAAMFSWFVFRRRGAHRSLPQTWQRSRHGVPLRYEFGSHGPQAQCSASVSSPTAPLLAKPAEAESPRAAWHQAGMPEDHVAMTRATESFFLPQ